MATSLELSLVRVRLLPLPFGGLFPFLVLFGDSHPPPFAQNSSFPSTVFRLHFCLLYVAVHVLRDSHTVPEAQTFPAAFYFPALVRTPTSPQPYCLFLPTQPSSRMSSQRLGLYVSLVSKATSPFSGICYAHFSNTNLS